MIKSSNKIHFLLVMKKTARKVFFHLFASPCIAQTVASPKTADLKYNPPCFTINNNQLY